MSIPQALSEIFAAIDAQDTDAFVAHLSPGATFRFGNAEPVQGREAVRAMIAGFYQAIAGIRHELIEAWEVDDTAICRGNVCYTRHDGSMLEVPFANVMKRSGAMIDQYLIYVDTSQLFA